MELPDSIKHLPQHVIDELFDRIERDPIIADLRAKQLQASARRDYVNSAKIGNKIKEVKERVLVMCYEEKQKELVKLEEVMKDMPDKDVSSLVEFSNAIAMCCDMIEGLVMDMEEVCRKHDGSMEIVSYAKIIEMGKAVKGQLELLNSNPDWCYLGRFGDTSDDMREMLLSKVKKMLREVTKRENHSTKN